MTLMYCFFSFCTLSLGNLMQPLAFNFHPLQASKLNLCPRLLHWALDPCSWLPPGHLSTSISCRKAHVQTSPSPPPPQTASPKFGVGKLEVIQVTSLFLTSHSHSMTSPAYRAHLPRTSHSCPVSTANKYHAVSSYLVCLPQEWLLKWIYHIVAGGSSLKNTVRFYYSSPYSPSVATYCLQYTSQTSEHGTYSPACAGSCLPL